MDEHSQQNQYMYYGIKELDSPAAVSSPSREISCWLGQLSLRQKLFSPADEPCTVKEAGVTQETEKSSGGGEIRRKTTHKNE